MFDLSRGAKQRVFSKLVLFFKTNPWKPSAPSRSVTLLVAALDRIDGNDAPRREIQRRQREEGVFCG